MSTMPNLLRRVLWLLFYIALAIYATVASTIIIIVWFPGWHPEAVRFFSRVWAAFLVHVGSTGPGFISPIIISVLSILLTIISISSLQGWSAMRENWISNVLITAVVTVSALGLVYLPQFIWQVAKVTRDEHQLATRTIERLEYAAKRPCPPPVEFIEPNNSLRRRTLRLFQDLEEFWSVQPLSPPGPVANPSSAEELQVKAKWEDYWRREQLAYSNARFKERLLKTVREYKNKGVETGFLEQGFIQADRMIGARNENCVMYMSEACQVRELAYHVDDHDDPVLIGAETGKAQ